ncbi:MAG TPA: TIGR03557 family F420-dependent LLM class oxidoreductase [Acidimicrobiales bacterium]|nr:TIGR03557 family F420-dependent LLM class oxidoreductase [Acidimicrobiales bacterium]
MTDVGYFLSSEEHGPSRLLRFARMGEEAGFRSVVVSDHYHPWTERQGESPFVWSVVGAIGAATGMDVMTGVTCPTVRLHPAILAQAAATSSLLLDGRFVFGVGSGEALNEHILGTRWPAADIRLEMLAEAVAVMRALWKGGFVTHRGQHFTVENARIYSRPDVPPPVYVSGFGPKATRLAAEIGDGYVNVAPEPDLIDLYRESGGKGPAVGLIKVCWAADESSARKLAHDVWPVTAVKAELNQELPMPAHFEQASEGVTEDAVAELVPCGPDPEVHARAIAEYLEAGYDRVFVSQIGEDQGGFLRFFFDEVRPRLEGS